MSYQDFNNRPRGFGWGPSFDEDPPAGTPYKVGTADELPGCVWDPRIRNYACDDAIR
jgi:hypothetical protein